MCLDATNRFRQLRSTQSRPRRLKCRKFQKRKLLLGIDPPLAVARNSLEQRGSLVALEQPRSATVHQSRVLPTQQIHAELLRLAVAYRSQPFGQRLRFQSRRYDKFRTRRFKSDTNDPLNAKSKTVIWPISSTGNFAVALRRNKIATRTLSRERNNFCCINQASPTAHYPTLGVERRKTNVAAAYLHTIALPQPASSVDFKN